MNSIPALCIASVCCSRAAASLAIVTRSQRIDVDASKTEVPRNVLDKFGHLVILRFDLVTRLDKKVFQNFNIAPGERELDENSACATLRSDRALFRLLKGWLGGRILDKLDG
jgi:hypothetical protein